MNNSPFAEAIAAQETAREGWMPDPVAELNQRLIDRQESFQAQLVRIENTWREKLVESKAEIDRLKKELVEARKDKQLIFEAAKAYKKATNCWHPSIADNLYLALEKHERLTSQRQ